MRARVRAREGGGATTCPAASLKLGIVLSGCEKRSRSALGVTMPTGRLPTYSSRCFLLAWLAAEPGSCASAARPSLGIAPIAAEPPTKCLRLEGLITPDMLTEAEYPEVFEDIKNECSESGTVVQLRIPRTGEPQAGLVFVTYETLAGAAKAKAALHKRQFDGNTVLASFVPEDPTTGSAPPA